MASFSIVATLVGVIFFTVALAIFIRIIIFLVKFPIFKTEESKKD